MRLDLPEQLYTLAKAAPFPLYAVGGAVRDRLAGLPATEDIDLCAPASAEAFSALAQKCGMRVLAVYKNTGTVNLEAGGCKIEFTSFRTDMYRGGEHAPARVTFTDSIDEDARRRDFRCNAVYYDIAREEIADPLGGAKDAAEHVLQTTRDADEVFSEDGLRLMRLARLAAQLGFTPTLECILGAKFNAARITLITAERVFAELRQLLYADRKYGRQYAHYDGLKLLEGTDVLPYILPELAAGKGLAQRADFHDHDVLEHSFRACKYADPRVRFAALLHDAGKPAVFAETGKYHGHDAAGAPIARAALERLKAPKKLCEEVERLTLLHMYDLDMKTRESKIRAFIVKNFDVYEPLLLLKQADYSGCKDDLRTCPGIEKWERIRAAMRAEGVPFSLRELAIRGNELPPEVPAARRAAILHELLLACAQDGRRNTRAWLADEAARLAAKEER